MNDPITEFLDDVDSRLDRGAAEYGNQSFMKPVAATVREILEEQVDQVGWCYVLWCQAARKAWPATRDQRELRQLFRESLDHRIRRNDRRAPHDSGNGASNAMLELEVLALDLFLQNTELQRRLQPIARAIEVAQTVQPYDHYRGRRGGRRDPRSDD